MEGKTRRRHRKHSAESCRKDYDVPRLFIFSIIYGFTSGAVYDLLAKILPIHSGAVRHCAFGLCIGSMLVIIQVKERWFLKRAPKRDAKDQNTA